VRESTRELFRKSGCILKEVPNIPNPYKETQLKRRTYKARFEFTFNKLYVWNLIDYERVIYLDADNLVVQNIDILFNCGHYCVTFFNPIYFHTGMMVIRPDRTEFRRLLKNLLTLESFSYDGADQGFLTAEFPQLDNAPLFDHRYVTGEIELPPHTQAQITRALQVPASQAPRRFEEPAMRFAMEYNLNSVFYYPSYSYDYFRRANLPFSNDPKLPIGSLDFCIIPHFKPWNWLPYIVFVTVREWHKVRSQLGDSWLAFGMSRLAIIIGYIAFWLVLHRALRAERFAPMLDKARVIFRAAVLKFPFIIPFTIFLVSIAWVFWFTTELLPQIVPPEWAWPLALLILFSTMYIALDYFALFIAPPGAALASHRGSLQLSKPFGATWFQIAIFSFHMDWFEVIVEGPSPLAPPVTKPLDEFDDDQDLTDTGTDNEGVLLTSVGNSARKVNSQQNASSSTADVQPSQSSSRWIVAFSFRNGVLPTVMLLPFITFLIAFYIAVVAEWHWHFVEKTLFFVITQLIFVASFYYTFVRARDICLGAPGALQQYTMQCGSIPFSQAVQAVLAAKNKGAPQIVVQDGSLDNVEPRFAAHAESSVGRGAVSILDE